MGVKLERLRGLVLAALVVLSFILSFQLWTAGRSTVREENSPGQSTRTNVSAVTHDRSDVFRPAHVVIHDDKNEDTVLISQTYPLRKLIAQSSEKKNLNELIRTELVDYEQYIAKIKNGHWLEFIYYEEQPIGMKENKFEVLPNETADVFYNRLLINVDDQSMLYLYNTETKILYVISVIEDETLELDAFLSQGNLPYVEAVPVIFEKNIVYLPTEPITLPNRSYVIDQLGNLVYINSFFPDTSAVDVRSNSGLTRYIDLTKEVSINDNTDTLNYLRQIIDQGELDPSTRFIRSFDQVNRFENWADTFILSNYNQEDGSLTFRRELDGVPVFSALDYESVSEITVVESGVTQLKLPLRFIRTPISIPVSNEKEATKDLISGVELLDQMQSQLTAETYNLIDNVIIGYEWEESNENKQVVNFTPEWYISVNDKWTTFDNLLKLQEEVAYGF